MTKFNLRLDSITENCLERLANATLRSKAQAARAAIQMAAKLVLDIESTTTDAPEEIHVEHETIVAN